MILEQRGTVPLVCAAAIAALFSAPLQQDPPIAPRRVIGLVEVPRLFGKDGAGEHAGPAVMLFHDASERAGAAATIRGRDGLELREHDYEMLSAVAYERRAGWFLLRIKGRFAWLAPRDAGEFRAYPQLLENRLVYLTRDWDRTLYRGPATALGSHVAAQSDVPVSDADRWSDGAQRPSDVLVVELRQHAGEWWAHVRLGPSICESKTQPPRVIAEGWVPAYGKTRHPNLWFYSRGC